MPSTGECSASPTRCSCSRRATSRSRPRSGPGSLRRASSTRAERGRYQHHRADSLRRMVVGLVGSGNIARALARGWGDPVLVTDAGSGRAAKLAEELGGEAVPTNAELAERADVLVLCHKPAALEEVARAVAGPARAVASVLAGVTLADLHAAYGETPVLRLMPNTAVEVRQGVT